MFLIGILWIIAAKASEIAFFSSNACVQTHTDIDLNEVNYSILLDVGSSSTRAYLVKYNKEHGIIDAVHVNTDYTPLASLTPRHASGIAVELVNDAYIQIPRKARKRTDAMILGTAGMRAIDHQKAHEIWSSIKYVLNQFDIRSVNVGSITGSDEALYSLLAVNYSKNALTFNGLNRTDVPGYSTLDMGSGSIEASLLTDCGISVRSLKSFGADKAMNDLIARFPSESVNCFNNGLTIDSIKSIVGQDTKLAALESTGTIHSRTLLCYKYLKESEKIEADKLFNQDSDLQAKPCTDNKPTRIRKTNCVIKKSEVVPEPADRSVVAKTYGPWLKEPSFLIGNKTRGIEIKKAPISEVTKTIRNNNVLAISGFAYIVQYGKALTEYIKKHHQNILEDFLSPNCNKTEGLVCPTKDILDSYQQNSESPTLTELEVVGQLVCYMPVSIIDESVAFKIHSKTSNLNTARKRCIHFLHLINFFKNIIKTDLRNRNITFSDTVDNRPLEWVIGYLLIHISEFGVRNGYQQVPVEANMEF